MSADTSNRIPDEMLADVLAEATRLHAEATAGYSFEDLQQACAEINIPPKLVKQAIANVEAQRMKHRLQWRRTQSFLKQQFLKGIPLGAAIFLGATPIVGFLRLYTPLEYKESSPSLTTMTVKEGELKYLEGPKDLSISVRSVSRLRELTGVISMDGYQEVRLEKEKCKKFSSLSRETSCATVPAEVGQSYLYQGLYQYQIKIITVDTDKQLVVFQIDRSDNKPTSPTKILEQKLKTLKTDSEASQQDLQQKISDLESKNDALKRSEVYADEKIKVLEQENQILKNLKSN
jgi:hypothetical protein